LSAEVKTAIYKHGLSPDRSYFMFEVDGFGNGVFMDDANLPSLLSLPLFGFIPAED
jgi:meiotically up-regulated gene 157 (Mug157) protein